MENNSEREQLIDEIARHYKKILELIGEDVNREGLVKTPRRAAKALVDITRGYKQRPDEIVKSALFEYAGSKIVVVKDIEFYSLCEHHILPFFGTVSIGYIPDGTMVGLSKLARVVDAFAHRLQVQERFTAEICDSLYENLSSKGVIVAVSAGHLCMKMRGVEKQGANTFTLEYRGDFENPQLRDEFFRMIKE
ncbi:MAG: GTP cyclohydrolase I FolE [Muribaculaceae bacterium]